MSVEKQLVIFDFDWCVIQFHPEGVLIQSPNVIRSMADQDTDRWIFEVLAPDLRRKMKNLKEEIQWTDLVYVSSNT